FHAVFGRGAGSGRLTGYFGCGAGLFADSLFDIAAQDAATGAGSLHVAIVEIILLGDAARDRGNPDAVAFAVGLGFAFGAAQFTRMFADFSRFGRALDRLARCLVLGRLGNLFTGFADEGDDFANGDGTALVNDDLHQRARVIGFEFDVGFV